MNTGCAILIHIEFYDVKEEMHNPDFNRMQFEETKNDAGLNRFVMTPTKWITQMNAVDITSKAVRYANCDYVWKDSKAAERCKSTIKGNMKNMATLNQLLVLVNLGNHNVVLANQNKS